MDKHELLEFLKDNMQVKISSDKNGRNSRFVVEISICNEEISTDYISIDELQEN